MQASAGSHSGGKTQAIGALHACSSCTGPLLLQIAAALGSRRLWLECATRRRRCLAAWPHCLQMQPHCPRRMHKGVSLVSSSALPAIALQHAPAALAATRFDAAATARAGRRRRHLNPAGHPQFPRSLRTLHRRTAEVRPTPGSTASLVLLDTPRRASCAPHAAGPSAAAGAGSKGSAPGPCGAPAARAGGSGGGGSRAARPQLALCRWGSCRCFVQPGLCVCEPPRIDVSHPAFLCRHPPARRRSRAAGSPQPPLAAEHRAAAAVQGGGGVL